TNTLLVYFKNVVKAFDIRFRQLGGKIVDRESYATGQNNVQSAVTRLNSHKAAVYVTSTAFGELPAFVSGMRSLHNNTPILNSWAGDGTYWDTQNPKVTNYYCVTFASVFGDDPSAAVRKMIASLTAAGSPPGTGGFLGGADAIEGVQALREVTLELRRREVVGLIGPNGAGKSTLVNVLSGFDRPDEGTVELEGREITGWSPQRRARAGLARTFQHSRSFGGLSVRENVEVAAL